MSASALTLSWWSMVSAMFFLFVAVTLALNYGTANALLGMAVAVFSFSLIGGALARYAIRTGLGCYLLSKILFGRVGASLATLIFFVTAIYYAVFEGSVVAIAAATIVPGISYPTACVIVVLYSVPLVAGSVQHWLNRFNGFLLPFYFVGLMATVVLTLREFGYSDRWLALGPDGRLLNANWWNCFVSYLGASVAFMFTQDYARFGRSEDQRYHANVNFGYVFYLLAFAMNGVIGIFLIGMTQLGAASEAAIIDSLVAVLGGGFALAFVWVSQTRINTANYYVSTVNMQAFFESQMRVRLPRIVWASGVGAVVLILMLATDVLSYILVALNYQGSFVTAWVGVALAHVLRHGSFVEPCGGWSAFLERLPSFRAAGMVSWLSGSGVSLALMQADGWARTFATPAALIVAGAAYTLLGQQLHQAQSSWRRA